MVLLLLAVLLVGLIPVSFAKTIEPKDLPMECPACGEAYYIFDCRGDKGTVGLTGTHTYSGGTCTIKILRSNSCYRCYWCGYVSIAGVPSGTHNCYERHSACGGSQSVCMFHSGLKPNAGIVSYPDIGLYVRQLYWMAA